MSGTAWLVDGESRRACDYHRRTTRDPATRGCCEATGFWYNCPVMSEPKTTARRKSAARDDAREFAAAAARIAHDNKSDDVVVLDLRGLSTLADYFVLATGSSDRQMHAVVDFVAEHARAAGRKAFKIANSAGGTWLLADYVDVVIHIFDAEHRRYYDLDDLWGDAPRVAWSSAGPADDD
jgi:ribosome-associated protein